MSTDTQPDYLLSDEDRAKGYARPFRDAYVHRYGKGCGWITILSPIDADTMARMPWGFSPVYCTGCRKYLPRMEFTWKVDGEGVGT